MQNLNAATLQAIVQVIQSSLTPAFLLTAVASLLNVFATRLGRVSDQVKALADKSTDDGVIQLRLKALRRRSKLLDIAVSLGAFAGACIAATVLVLFLGLVLSKETVMPLFYLFSVAVLCTIGALTAFLAEILLASSHIRNVVDRHTGSMESKS